MPVDPPFEAKTASTASAVELPLADPVSQLEAGERRRRGEERFETLQGPTPRFDAAMVLLDDVVQVLVRANAHIAPLQMLPSKPPQCGATRHVTIERDGAREALAVRVERLAKEGLGCSDSAVAAQQEVDGLAVLVNRPILVVPLSPNADVRLVGSPRPTDAATESVPVLLKFRHESKGPSKDCRVHYADAPLGHHLHQVAIGEPIADVPPHTEHNHLGVKPALSGEFGLAQSASSCSSPFLNHLGYRTEPQVHQNHMVYQPRKIQRSGIWAAVGGAVLITIHKQQMLAPMQKRYPAAHYVMVDDKPLLLAQMKQAMGDKLTTIFVRQGKYAAAAPADLEPAPDRAIAAIGELRQFDLASLEVKAK